MYQLLLFYRQGGLIMRHMFKNVCNLYRNPEKKNVTSQPWYCIFVIIGETTLGNNTENRNLSVFTWLRPRLKGTAAPSPLPPLERPWVGGVGGPRPGGAESSRFTRLPAQRPGSPAPQLSGRCGRHRPRPRHGLCPPWVHDGSEGNVCFGEVGLRAWWGGEGSRLHRDSEAPPAGRRQRSRGMHAGVEVPSRTAECVAFLSSACKAPPVGKEIQASLQFSQQNRNIAQALWEDLWNRSHVPSESEMARMVQNLRRVLRIP